MQIAKDHFGFDFEKPETIVGEDFDFCDCWRQVNNEIHNIPCEHDINTTFVQILIEYVPKMKRKIKSCYREDLGDKLNIYNYMTNTKIRVKCPIFGKFFMNGWVDMAIPEFLYF